jgi:hypothetical protein
MIFKRALINPIFIGKKDFSPPQVFRFNLRRLLFFNQQRMQHGLQNINIITPR